VFDFVRALIAKAGTARLVAIHPGHAWLSLAAGVQGPTDPFAQI
jgi:hypothetical protein